MNIAPVNFTSFKKSINIDREIKNANKNQIYENTPIFETLDKKEKFYSPKTKSVSKIQFEIERTKIVIKRLKEEVSIRISMLSNRKQAILDAAQMEADLLDKKMADLDVETHKQISILQARISDLEKQLKNNY